MGTISCDLLGVTICTKFGMVEAGQCLCIPRWTELPALAEC